MVGSPACSVGTSDAAALLPLAKGMSDAPHAPERKAAFLAKFEAANQPSCGLPVLRSLRHTSRSESAQNDTSCQDGANSLSSSGLWAFGWGGSPRDAERHGPPPLQPRNESTQLITYANVGCTESHAAKEAHKVEDRTRSRQRHV
eukprot:scaffold15742_cov71-Phaeocystis_antarctica.AAC.10